MSGYKNKVLAHIEKAVDEIDEAISMMTPEEAEGTNLNSVRVDLENAHDAYDDGPVGVKGYWRRGQ